MKRSFTLDLRAKITIAQGITNIIHAPPIPPVYVMISWGFLKIQEIIKTGIDRPKLQSAFISGVSDLLVIPNITKKLFLSVIVKIGTAATFNAG